jgi:hypothetical protein
MSVEGRIGQWATHHFYFRLEARTISESLCKLVLRVAFSQRAAEVL